MRPHRTLIRLIFVLGLIGQISSERNSDIDQYDQDTRHNKSNHFLSSQNSSTGWRQVGQFGSSSSPDQNQSRALPGLDHEVVSLGQTPGDSTAKQLSRANNRSASLPSVQWDDEGASNEAERGEDVNEKRSQPAKKHVHKMVPSGSGRTSHVNLLGASNMLEAPQKSHLKDAHTMNKFRHEAPYDGPPKYSKALFGLSDTPARSSGKLIYHGRLAAGSNSSRVQRRVVAGLEVQVDTHKPVAISRFSPIDLNRAQHDSTNSLFMFRTGEEQDKSLLAAGLQEQAASSSDWRPIVVASGRSRRSGKTENYNSWPKSRETEQNLSTTTTTTTTTMMTSRGETTLSTLSPAIDSKWRPLTDSHKLSSGKPDGAKRSVKSSFRSSSNNWTAFRSDSNRGNSNKRKGLESARNIEQPFDRDDELEHTRDEEEDRRAGSSGDLMRLNPADRWKPLATTTSRPEELLASSSATTIAAEQSTTQAPVGAGNQANGNSSSEAAQKSASDLSYIYSSQPDSVSLQQPLVQQQVSSNSYYGQPQIQQQQQQEVSPQQQITSAIVDTTSGQTPEMVPDRASVESYPMRSSYGTYSDLQTINFPPAQPQQVALPMRQPSAYYGGAQVASSGLVGGTGFDSGSYYQPSRAIQTPPPTRQSAPPPQQQLVRQEHHHHYYNSPPPPQNTDRQQVAPSPAPAPVQPTVIRELQPIMISQPVVQQPSSTTAAPQIIREIIKEVPMQTVQVQPVQVPTRFVVQSVPPPPIPVIPAMPNLIREVSGGSYDNSPAYGVAPAKRFMRQLSESMPQVAIRMPASAPFRLQVPTIQALRSSGPPAASLTRQTGSFVVPARPKKTTTLMTETQEIPLHTTIIHSTEYTPATRTTVYTTDHSRR